GWIVLPFERPFSGWTGRRPLAHGPIVLPIVSWQAKIWLFAARFGPGSLSPRRVTIAAASRGGHGTGSGHTSALRPGIGVPRRFSLQRVTVRRAVSTSSSMVRVFVAIGRGNYEHRNAAASRAGAWKTQVCRFADRRARPGHLRTHHLAVSRVTGRFRSCTDVCTRPAVRVNVRPRGLQ